jgi:hypothetical protein
MSETEFVGGQPLSEAEPVKTDAGAIRFGVRA